MAVLLYKDEACRQQIQSYTQILGNVTLNPFNAESNFTDSTTIWAKKQGSETSEHIVIYLTVMGKKYDKILSLEVGDQATVRSSFTKQSDGSLLFDNIEGFAPYNFVFFSNSLYQITSIDGNKVTINNFPNYNSGYVAKIIPLGDTTNPVKITIKRELNFADFISDNTQYLSFELYTMWA